MEFIWQIDALDCKKELNGLTNVVQNVHWRLTGVENEVSASMYGSLAMAEPKDFLDFDDLTKEVVVAWVEDALPVQMMKEQIATEINGIENVTLQLK